ncbi:MAG TPA: lysophospholipid acyltransferase family protein [Gemmatimonadota bacterium]|nr:lysophospholipid acyltransferase family protein [Gemmatimonadota bacterium]
MTHRRETRGSLWWVYAFLRTASCWALLAILTVGVASVYIPAVIVRREGSLARSLEWFWVWCILRASNVKLSARGLDNVAAGSSYIVMANHRSMYDIPVLHYLLGRDVLGRGRDLRWIGKQELVRVPFLGWAFEASRHVAIDRDNRVRAIAALEAAAAASEQGVSFIIMPEGTRSADGRLLPFKKGGFHLAIDTGLPILPVAIRGSEELMRKGEWWILPGAIDVVVRPAIETVRWEKDRLEELIGRVREEIQAALGEDPEPLAVPRRGAHRSAT